MVRRKKGNPVHGWLVVDKPIGMGSTDVVRAAKRSLQPLKVGHAGTLDPFASGILPLAFGEATKTIPFVQDASKDYLFTLQFGVETDTLDLDGTVINHSDHTPTQAELAAILPEFLGHVQQLPPKFSALKVKGQRAYDLARKGIDFDLSLRSVCIYSLDMLTFNGEGRCAELRVSCGKGTYVRSLARDIAYKLGTYGHLTKLRRTRVGALDLSRAISFEKMETLGHSATADSALLELSTVLDDIPAFAVTAPSRDRLRQGQALSWSDVSAVSPMDEVSVSDRLVLLLHNHQPVAMANADSKGIRPVRVFNLNLDEGEK